MELHKIHFSANSNLIDSRVKISMSGLSPCDIVMLKAEMQDNFGVDWESCAVFEADTEGRVDLMTAQPISGTYSEADAAGLFWSMLPNSNAPSKKQTPLNPLEVKLILKRQEALLDVLSLKRHFVLPEVKRIPVREQGIVATLFS